MAAVPLGILLAMSNVLVIGIGMQAGGRERDIVVLVLIFGSVPSILVGALLGWLADVMKPLPVWARQFVLIVPAVLLVIVLGAAFGMQRFIFVSCIPTAVATLVLERATRLAQTPPLPPAQARR